MYIASAGFQADIRALQKMLQTRNVMYQHIHRKPMSASALAQLLGNNLYYKRFFPYFTWNLCVGLDPEGVVCLTRHSGQCPHLLPCTLEPLLSPDLPYLQHCSGNKMLSPLLEGS